MKRRHIFWTGFMIGAGLVAYFYEKRLKKEQYLAATRLQTVQRALDKATYVPTKEEADVQMEADKRAVAWAMIPEWLEMDEESRRSLVLEIAPYGMSSIYPDAEMIAEYKRLEAEGKLNPADFDEETLFLDMDEER